MINLSSLEELLPEGSSPNETSVIRGTYHSFVSATAMHYVIPDGATVPVPVADSLVDAASLKAGDRVVMMRQRQRQFILGKSGGIPLYEPSLASEQEAIEGMSQATLITPKTLHAALGRAGFDVPIVLDRDSLYMSYSERNNTMDFEDRVKLTVLESGAVVLSGLVFIEGTPAGGKIIGTFPEEYAPEYVTVIPVEMGDTPRSVYIHPDGTIRAGAFYSANTYLSLDGVAFIRKGFGSWTNLGPFGTNFAAHNAAYYGSPAYWKDEYGFVWWRGAVTISSTAGIGDNSQICSLPVGVGFYDVGGASSEGHYRAVANDGLAVIGIRRTVLRIKLNTPMTLNAVIHLGGLVSMTQDALTHAMPKLVWASNSWTNYSSAHPDMRFGKRPDGLVFTSGLIGSGAIGSYAFAFPDRTLSPQEGTKILASVSSHGRARIDVAGLGTTDQLRKGRFFPQQGSNGWFSLDGKVWIP